MQRVNVGRLMGAGSAMAAALQALGGDYVPKSPADKAPPAPKAATTYNPKRHSRSIYNPLTANKSRECERRRRQAEKIAARNA